MDNISVPIIDYSITALTKNFFLSLLIITILTVPIYDFVKRHWRRIYSTEERNERTLKALKLNNAVSHDATFKSTIRIKRLSYHFKRREKASRLDSGLDNNQNIPLAVSCFRVLYSVICGLSSTFCKSKFIFFI
jgi:hypothetical protein